MPVFEYRGRGEGNELVTGRFEAASADAVASHLSANRIVPIDINPVRSSTSGSDISRLRLLRPRVKQDDLIFFCSQMYTLLRAGVPIMDALRGLHETTPSDPLARVIGEIRDSLDSGMELSSAMRRHPEIFPTLFWGIIEIGEASGQLSESFMQLSVYLERERDTSSKIRSAMRYPLAVIGAIVIAMTVINIFVIPAFAEVFEQFNARLPVMTRVLIAVSEVTVDYWYLLLLLVIGLAVATRTYVHSEHGAFQWDRMKLRLPLIGDILYNAALSRFAFTLAVTSRANVPWARGMTVVSNAVNNRFVAGRVIRIRDAIEGGETITHSVAAGRLFPPLVLQMIQVGEHTGEMDRMLSEVADYFEREMDYKLKMLSGSIEPLLLLVLGAIVLVLALGVFMPMWGLGRAALS